MFRIAYVLTSSRNDVFYEQLMVSIKSVKYHMKKQKIVVVVDTDTYKTFTGDRKSIFEYAEVISIKTPNKYSQKESSRWLKTSLRNIIDGDFLFVDCDTVICRDFMGEVIDEPLAMVLEFNHMLSEHTKRNKLYWINRFAECGWEFDSNELFNSGVMWVKDTPETRRFFSLWNEYWQKTLEHGVSADQPALNYINQTKLKMISILDGTWNCQVSSAPAGVEYLSEAKIIHYFHFNNDSAYKLCDLNVIMNEKYKCELEDIFSNSVRAFKPCYFVAVGSQDDLFMDTIVYRALRKAMSNHKIIFNICEKIANVVLNLKSR